MKLTSHGGKTNPIRNLGSLVYSSFGGSIPRFEKCLISRLHSGAYRVNQALDVIACADPFALHFSRIRIIVSGVSTNLNGDDLRRV